METKQGLTFSFEDKRLNERGERLLQAMNKVQSAVIHRLGNWA
jgi:hypothetical protein